MNMNMNKRIWKPALSNIFRSFRTAYVSFKDEQGSAGSIREAGGAFAKMGAAKENEYFYKKQAEQLRQLTNKDVCSEEFQKNQMDKFKKYQTDSSKK